MELVPNEFYWDGAPKLDKLINRYFVDEAAAVLALESGDIDFADQHFAESLSIPSFSLREKESPVFWTHPN
jgi:ABC-type transport system substrate-binding protein